MLLVITAAALAASYMACRAIVDSRAGRVIRAIRDAESRTRFLGYPVETYKLWLFVFSAIIAGVAGALYVPQIGIINPSEFSPINSIEAVIWVAVGGRGTLYGAVAGAVLVNYAKTYLTGAFPEVWLYALGRIVRAGDGVSAARDYRPGAGAAQRQISGRSNAMERSQKMSVRDKRLYLEDLTVSFDGFKALNELTLYVDPGELLCIIGPNGAGKTTMMDVITGKTRPDSGTAWFGSGINLLRAVRGRNCGGRNRAEVSEADRVRTVDGVREPGAGVGRHRSFLKTLRARITPAQNERIDEVLEIIGLSAQRSVAGKNTRARPEAVARNRHAVDAEPGAAPGGRAGGRHDAARDRAHGRTAAVAGGRAFGGGCRARYGLRSIHRPPRRGVARRHVIAEGNMDKVQKDPRVIEVYLGSVSVLAIKALNQFYGGSHTLWDVDLAVPAGSRMCLMGRNGMGKTTLLKCIMGLQAASSGGITFDGSDLLKCPAEQRARLGIGYVPQGREIFSHLTVEENLRVGLGVRKNGPRTIPSRIFDLFPVLKKMMNRRGGDLSGGQQQQLAIGRALVLEPKLLILDEPTEGIQPNIVHEIGDIVLRLNQEEGLTVLLVEQKLPFARRVASEFCILDKGRRVAAGSIGELTDEVVRAAPERLT